MALYLSVVAVVCLLKYSCEGAVADGVFHAELAPDRHPVGAAALHGGGNAVARSHHGGLIRQGSRACKLTFRKTQVNVDGPRADGHFRWPAAPAPDIRRLKVTSLLRT